MSEIHLDHPGDLHWFKGYGPLPVIGPCPHHQCRHNAQSTIAWGPDKLRYELVACDVDEHCNGSCRAWTDGSFANTSPWLQVAA